MPSAPPSVEVDVDDKVVRVTNPDRVYFPESGATKLDLVDYYLAVGDGIVNALFERPCMLHRFPQGLAGAKVHQKRLPAGAPPWVETVRLFFPRWGRTADELCVTELASVIWAVQMSTVEFHPWNSRRADTEKPDEWRIDLDPMPKATFEQVRKVAGVAKQVLDELGISEKVTAIGVAKGADREAGRERFFMEGRESFSLPVRDPLLYFIQRLRDEAHRFAIGSHRARRKKELIRNPLDEIAGIGPGRKRALLHHFGTAKAVSRAAVEDLAGVDGISEAMARQIYNHFHESGA